MTTKTIEERRLLIMARATRIKEELNGMVKDVSSPEFFQGDKDDTIGEALRHELGHVCHAAQAVSAIAGMNACQGPGSERPRTLLELFRGGHTHEDKEDKEPGTN